jgi:hypothetical protein
MPSLGIRTSHGHPLAHDILATCKLLKLIGASAGAYCWRHINGHGDYKESSIMPLLGINKWLEMVFILEKCGSLVDKKRLVEQLARGNKVVGKKYCEAIP